MYGIKLREKTETQSEWHRIYITYISKNEYYYHLLLLRTQLNKELSTLTILRDSNDNVLKIIAIIAERRLNVGCFFKNDIISNLIKIRNHNYMSDV